MTSNEPEPDPDEADRRAGERRHYLMALPLLFVSSLLLIGTGIRVAQKSALDAEEALGMGAGFVLLGAWACLEILRTVGR